MPGTIAFYVVNACCAKRSAALLLFCNFPRGISLLRENYNLVVIARLEFRGYIVCLRVTMRYLRMVIWMVHSVGRSEEDKFSIEYLITHTWPCITLDYEKKNLWDFLRFRWRNAAEIFFARGKYYDERMRFVIPFRAEHRKFITSVSTPYAIIVSFSHVK